jgi:DNA (cytosine-5)-methyltransferase 1
MKFVDLCSGIGGFHYALKNLGMTCVMASEIDKDCVDNYTKNHKLKPRGDLSKIDINTIPSFDILCAGFPCQPFSKAGVQQGFKDSRGNIFFDICKIIDHHKPSYIILENVRNIATHDKGNTWKVIKDSLCELNYNTYAKPVILNTLYFGVPQSRERVVIMCKRKDLGELDDLPELSKKNIKETSIRSIIEEKVDDNRYSISNKLKETESVWTDFISLCYTNNVDIPKFPIWTDWWDSDGDNTSVTKCKKGLSPDENKIMIKEKQDAFHKKYKKWIDSNRLFYKKHNDIFSKWLIESRDSKKLWKGAVRKMEWQVKDVTKKPNMDGVLWSPRGSGVRIKDTNYTPTLVAMASMIPVYGPLSRHLTPRECARLQSFPENYIPHEKDSVAYKQFGNAVNIKMIEGCARFLIKKEPLLF